MMRTRLLALLLLLPLATVLASGPAAAIPATPEPDLRIAYLIPSNRTAQPTAEANLHQMLGAVRAWTCEQMDLAGFGRLTQRFELEPDGKTPKIHTIPVSETDDYLRGDPWDRTRAAATGAGVPLGAAGEIWLLIPEAHVMNPDGSIDGTTSLGAGGGGNAAGDSAGTAMAGSDRLSILNLADMQDDTSYDGLVIPGIGPFPLDKDTSYPSFAGTTVSSLASAYLGALSHEFTHGFAIGHDLRHDSNAHGNLMGNGFRGMRGALLPHLYTGDTTRLAWSTALALSVSRYFTGCDSPTPPAPPGGAGPSVTVLTSGSVTPVDGHIQVDFSASDPDGLALALFRWTGPPSNNTVGELVLSGTSVTTSFVSRYYEPGQSNSYQVRVYDALGNRTTGTTTLTPANDDPAPQPRFRVIPAQAAPGENVLLDGSVSGDADDFEWQFEEGQPFTAPSSSDTAVTSYAAAGARRATLRATNNQGSATSTPVALRIGGPCGDGLDNDGDGLPDFLDPGCQNAESPREDPLCDDDLDNDGDGRTDWDGGSGGGVPDPQCGQPWGNREHKRCGLGFELALLLPSLLALRRRRR